MKQQLLDYGLHYQQIPILYDNTSIINLTKNHVLHFKTKHIQIHHHFIRDHVQRDDISLRFIQINLQLSNIFTKPIDETWFAFICREFGLLDPSKNDFQK